MDSLGFVSTILSTAETPVFEFIRCFRSEDYEQIITNILFFSEIRCSWGFAIQCGIGIFLRLVFFGWWRSMATRSNPEDSPMTSWFSGKWYVCRQEFREVFPFALFCSLNHDCGRNRSFRGTLFFGNCQIHPNTGKRHAWQSVRVIFRIEPCLSV